MIANLHPPSPTDASPKRHCGSVILAYDRIGREVTVNVVPGDVHALGEVVVEVGAWGNIDWPED